MAGDILVAEIPRDPVPIKPRRPLWLTVWRGTLLFAAIVLVASLTGFGYRIWRRTAAIARLRKFPASHGAPDSGTQVSVRESAWHRSFSEWRRSQPKWISRPAYRVLSCIPPAMTSEVHTISLPESVTADADMQSLWALPEVRSLNIRKSKVSDASLPVLLHLKHLTFLNIRNTQISEAGYERLQAALPRTKIYWAR